MSTSLLSYADIGFPVLPVRRGSKQPACPRGVYDATTDRATLHRWRTEYPDCNIAVAAGTPINAFVVDIDPRNKGWESLASLELEYGELPDTVTNRTPGGGEHRLYLLAHGMRLRAKLAPGIDILSTGRYFLVPPSVGSSGGSYRWVRSPWTTKIASPPAWLLDLIVDKSHHQVDSVSLTSAVPKTEDGSGIANAMHRATAYVDATPGAVSGEGGHNATFELAVKLVLGFGLGDSDALALMRRWNTRCKPEWSEKALQRKVHEARKRGRLPLGFMDR